MKIAIIGYGKMGKEIDKIAQERGHEVVARITKDKKDYTPQDIEEADVAIEFSVPSAVKENIKKCFSANVPIVVGTTAWYEDFDEIKSACENMGQSLFYATNFSIGVNIFFKINEVLAELMNSHKEYDVSMTEIHHTQKLDAPSGTAITLAEGIIDNYEKKNLWVNENTSNEHELDIISIREPEVPGTHVVEYKSEVDQIEIKHQANSRKGFALGSVVAAEWLVGKKGVFTMKDMLNL